MKNEGKPSLNSYDYIVIMNLNVSENDEARIQIGF